MKFTKEQPETENTEEGNDGYVTRRKLLIAAIAGFVASKFPLKSTEAEAREISPKQLIEYLLSNLKPNTKIIDTLTDTIRDVKSRDKILIERLKTKRAEIGNKTLPDYIFNVVVKDIKDYLKRDKNNPEIQTDFILMRLFPGLIAQESAMNPIAESKGGAVGLAQITDIAFNDISRHNPSFLEDFFARYKSNKDMPDPRADILTAPQMGFLHLKENMKKYVKNAVKELADKIVLQNEDDFYKLLAYFTINSFNAGHTPIKKMCRAYGQYVDNLYAIVGTPNENEKKILNATKELERIRSLSPLELFTDIVLFERKNNNAPNYGDDAASYVYLVIGNAKLLDRVANN